MRQRDMHEELAELEPQHWQTLAAWRFDHEAFARLRARYRSGQLGPGNNRIQGQVRAPQPQDLRALADRDSPEGRRREALGREALFRGEVGVLLLNGGMATRFGGGVKGCVEVLPGFSFLGLKLRDVARFTPQPPVLVMNSFATDAATRQHLDEHGWFGLDAGRVQVFHQGISLRLGPDGELFRDSDGGPSFYAPGHGDVIDAMRQGPLDWFEALGGRYLLMSNVDNALATLDPLVIGTHIEAARDGVAMTVETVERRAGDLGGLPARVDGRMQIVEAFRFPAGFALDSIPVFNTNSIVFNADVLRQEAPLNWYVVEKEVDGRPAVQFERLVGELSAHVPTAFVVVPREGGDSRFLPVKRREELQGCRAIIAQRLGLGSEGEAPGP